MVSPILFFVRVNQVLVRLWARAMRDGVRLWIVVCPVSRRPIACLTGRAV